ncbi:MAG TPA: hypothetical protein VGE26_02140 [Sphingobacteriaceae bacterium]
MFKPKLIYVYDAWCGWCYGFTPVISAITKEFSGRLNHEVLSGRYDTGSYDPHRAIQFADEIQDAIN